ncbi:MAG TPA: DUF4214 domain-containing protein, partial [Planctomycetaceae bacterium]|nr:DUF4214 domain-containing protein [Planctomycetaceae bacterium]
MATLTATVAGGTIPLTYHWYDGQSDDTSTPVGMNSAQFTTPPITITKNYWVNVSNSCGAVPSATVTVTPQACQKPVITVDPVSQTITSGGSASLLVGNSGTGPLAYQWYQGQSADTSNPILGANASQFTTPALTQTTSYWVHVSNSCGSADSRTATITIPGSCTTPSFTMQPGSVTLDSGQQTFLAATASDATSYQWFKGAAGDESNPMTGIAASNARFVNQLYIDVLHRPADAGANLFTSALDSSTLTRAQVAAAVLASTEYRTNLIGDDYNAYLHRSAASAEIAFWLPAFTAGITDEQFASQIFGSPEYYALAGSTNALWLSHVYSDVLGRSPTAVETAFFTAELASGSRTTVALVILTSTESRTRLIQSWFSRFLRRAGSSSQVAFFVSALAAGSKDEQVMAAILASEEYFNFGTILPTGPLSSTTSFWVKATNSNGNCSTNSSTATVTIRGCSPPAIATQPQNTTATVGDSATLIVVATGAASYQWYQGVRGDVSNPVTGATSSVLVTAPLFSIGNVQFWVKLSNSCESTNSAAATVAIACGTPKAPMISAPPSHNSQNLYNVSWSGDLRLSTKYDLQEATTPDFSDATTFTITDGSVTHTFKHAGIDADTRYYYRVRAYAICNGLPGTYSTSASTLVTAPPPPTAPLLNNASAPCTTQTGSPCLIIGNLTGTFIKSGKTTADTTTYAVIADKPWITFTPATGTVPDNGQVTVQYTIDLAQLGIGSTDATVTFTYSTASAKTAPLGGTTQTIPVSVSLVTPVTPQAKDNNPPPNTVLIPAIAHAAGINSQFQSDVRVTNTAPQPITYLLTYTPSNTDGTQTGKQSSITIDAGETKALDDIVRNWYGSGSLGEAGVGTLEIRPLNYAGKTGVNVSFATVAASRTYNTTSNGTFGQYIPAIPLIDFLAKSDVSTISLQQIAQSSAFRTNLGFVEGSGQPIDFVVS